MKKLNLLLVLVTLFLFVSCGIDEPKLMTENGLMTPSEILKGDSVLFSRLTVEYLKQHIANKDFKYLSEMIEEAEEKAEDIRKEIKDNLLWRRYKEELTTKEYSEGVEEKVQDELESLLSTIYLENLLPNYIKEVKKIENNPAEYLASSGVPPLSFSIDDVVENSSSINISLKIDGLDAVVEALYTKIDKQIKWSILGVSGVSYSLLDSIYADNYEVFLLAEMSEVEYLTSTSWLVNSFTDDHVFQSLANENCKEAKRIKDWATKNASLHVHSSLSVARILYNNDVDSYSTYQKKKRTAEREFITSKINPELLKLLPQYLVESRKYLADKEKYFLDRAKYVTDNRIVPMEVTIKSIDNSLDDNSTMKVTYSILNWGIEVMATYTKWDKEVKWTYTPFHVECIEYKELEKLYNKENKKEIDHLMLLITEVCYQ